MAGAAAARGARAVRIDFARAMVEEAGRRFPQAEFRLGDAEALPFEDASFDALLCPFGLLHLAEPERGMAEAHRVLRPGGRYAFTVWHGPGLATPTEDAALGYPIAGIPAHAMGRDHPREETIR